MKPLFIIAAILSSPAIAHEAVPETQFFRDELAKNPMIGAVLNFCHLVGIDSEENCKEEMYEKNGGLNPIRIDAASKCVEKSGMQYRANLDIFFKQAQKNQWVSHQDVNYGWHLFPMNDPKAPKEPKHWYFYTTVDMHEAGLAKGDEYMERLRKQHQETGTTTLKDSVLMGVKAGGDIGIVKTEASLSGGKEESVTKGPLTAAHLKAAWNEGYAYGKSHPESLGRKPSGFCDGKGTCGDQTHQFPQDQLLSEVSKDLRPKSETASAQPQPVPENKDLPPNPFDGLYDPLTSETATGGIKIEKEKDPEDKKPKDSSTTTLGPEDTQNLERMRGCLEEETYKLYKIEGQKTKDPNAESEEEKRLRAEQQLQQGFCDESYWGIPFCQQWKHELTKTTSSTAEPDAQAAYEEAMREFQSGAGCNEMVLGFEFCHAARVELDSHRVPESPEDPTWLQPGGEEPAPVNPVDPGPEPMSGTDGVGAPSCPEWNPDCGR